MLLLKGLGAALQRAAGEGTGTLEVPTRCMLSLYAGGAPGYRDKCDEVAAAGYAGMVLR